MLTKRNERRTQAAVHANLPGQRGTDANFRTCNKAEFSAATRQKCPSEEKEVIQFDAPFDH